MSKAHKLNPIDNKWTEDSHIGSAQMEGAFASDHQSQKKDLSKPSLFPFTPESDPNLVKNTERRENRAFLSHLIGVSTVSTGLFLYLLFPWGIEKQIRTPQSLTPPPPPISKTFSLKPFVLRLKTADGFRLSKIQATLHITPSPALREEIESSSATIEDHLLFILSDKPGTIWTNPKQLEVLKQEIIHHLNLFLVEGKIKTIDIQQDFLHP